MVPSGNILVSWDAAGHLNIKTTLPMDTSGGRKEAIEKLLDAARAVNSQGTPLAMPTPAGTRILGGRG